MDTGKQGLKLYKEGDGAQENRIELYLVFLSWMSWQKGILEFWGRKHCAEDYGKFLVWLKVSKQMGFVSGRTLFLILIPRVILQLKVFIGQSVLK